MATARLESIATAWRLPGVALVPFGPGAGEPWCHGFRDPETRAPVTPQTVFPLASVTKTFTAELLRGAVADGLLSWDAPLRAILPGFALHQKAEAEGMTVRDAACHRSGLPPHTWAWVFGDVDRRRFVFERLPHLEAAGPFREKHRYSNILYAVLGQLLEEVSGQSWEERIRQRILEPLGLDHSGHLVEAWPESSVDIAVPCGADGGRIPWFVARRNHLIAPASEMLGSMEDLARWGTAMLAQGPDCPLWQPECPVSSERFHPVQGPLFYGLGWRVDQYRGLRQVWHSGQCSGYSVLLSLLPGQNTGLALATNASGAIKALYALAHSVYDQRLAPGDAVDWLKVFPPPELPRSSPPPAAPSAGVLPESRAGLYRNPGYGDLAVLSRRGQFFAKFQNAEPTPLLPRGENGADWRLPVYGTPFALRWDADGAGLSIPFEAQVAPVHFRRV